jgi:cell division septation protein DedD
LPATPAPASAGPWFVQLGSFGSRDNAERLQARLRAAGHAAVIAPLGGAGGTSYRVRIARPDRAAAESLRAMLARGEGYRGILVHD